MKGKMLKRLMCILAACFLLFGSVLTVGAAEPFEVIGDVTPSDKAYSVMFTGIGNLMLRNEKAVDLSVGKRYYMTYTVDEVEKNEMTQNGVVITQDAEAEWPYEKGMMHYDFSGDLLFEEGATYFYRVEVTEDGFSYLVAKMGKEDSCWVELPVAIGETNTDCKYFGIWLADNVSAKLSAVLCYDEKGNDLGIAAHNQAVGATIYDSSVLTEQEVGQYYEFSLTDECNLSISNEKATDSKVVYMSYRVENVKRNEASQSGIAYSSAPRDGYPHASGILNYQFCEDGKNPLFIEGAEYLIYASVEDEKLLTLVKRTVNGVEETFAFPIHYGKYNENAAYFSIWHGDGEYGITADIKDFRCYDAEGNNLGVQTNKTDIQITKFGPLDDYSNCDAVYWCEANNTVIILDDEQSARIKLDEKDAETSSHTYVVEETTLTMNVNGEKVKYDYYYGYMLDASGNRYERLGDTKVEFVTGLKEHEGNQIVNVTAADGYKVAKPENPKVDGYTFETWCLADGTEFDFDRFVTDSVTLYAKYAEGDIHDYQEVGSLGNAFSAEIIIAIAVSSILIVATVAGVVFMLKKEGKKNDSSS